MLGFIPHPCVGYWDIASSSRENGLKIQNRKTRKQRRVKIVSTSRNILNLIQKISHVELDGFHGPVEPVVYLWVNIN